VRVTPDGRVDRSASLVRIARVLYDVGLPREAIAGALAERDVRLGWEKYAGRRDARARYEAIVTLVVNGTRTRRRQR
jgi:hypothetical protein